MAEDTKIEWATHTFNPWIGCTPVSGACDHCYAESLAKRYGWAKWGVGENRLRTSAANWRKPLAWNKAAKASGTRPRVFYASLADVFDAEVPDDWRRDLFLLIGDTPNLDWLLLSKRPQVAAKWFKAWPMPPNIWLGTTVEDQKMADIRIPILLSIPAKVRFLSCEPLLGPVDLTRIPSPVVVPEDEGFYHSALERSDIHYRDGAPDALTGRSIVDAVDGPMMERLDWIIAGGESGPKARPSMVGWMRSLRNQCQAAGVPFFFRQWGEFAPDDPAAEHTAMRRIGKKAAGAELDGREWREFPRMNT